MRWHPSACMPQQAGLTNGGMGPRPNGGGSIMIIMIGGTNTIRHWMLQTVAAPGDPGPHETSLPSFCLLQ